MRGIRRHVLGNESAADRANGKNIIVTIKSSPFGKVIGKVKSRGSGGCIFVVDEADRFDRLAFIGDSRVYNDIATQKITMREDKLDKVSVFSAKIFFNSIIPHQFLTVVKNQAVPLCVQALVAEQPAFVARPRSLSAKQISTSE